MALQSSGPISINDIRTELSSSSGSLRTLSAAAGKSTPDAMSEFYGYSNVDFTSTMTVGSWTFNPGSGIKNYYGFIENSYGSMTNQYFNGEDIIRLGWTNDNGGEIFLWFDNPPYPDWNSITINGTVFPTKALWTYAFAQFRYSTSTNPFGTSGNITITAVY
jgi:hypothetical protein